ncbi:hypothetical protein COV93_07290 [Candidatus Woesearchaeota archaeon CG11_big_fil_rev_8_21_14_0_20_43_8]|nr:MAG: hypothetical protein COV93_07290 [Candidatus Woesearchaeota archaeon CG11_big_fil_rev_8_21_14_0_20_43_8]PIO08908.1 MAG: hypothetical protein COT47_00700 [Candidatus Woesearchaeota archaeon CG08_land_8_20_14_0_20_43_7]
MVRVTSYTITPELERLKLERSSTFQHSHEVADLSLKVYHGLKRYCHAGPSFIERVVGIFNGDMGRFNHICFELDYLGEQDMLDGAMYHDIGKLCLDDDMLVQRSNLREWERKEIETHSQHGYEMMKNFFSQRGDVLDCILYHHESYNGKGYPTRLKAEDIPLCARIVTVADHFDAMTHRPSFDENNNVLSPKEVGEALVEMTKMKKKYDPLVFMIFKQVVSSKK